METNLRSLPECDRPRERLRLHGQESLATAELIAIILGSGMKGKSVLQLAQEIISHFGSLEKLSQATLAELCAIKGLGPAKAVQLLAAIGLSTRLVRQGTINKSRVMGPSHVYELVRDDLEQQQRELFVVILLDTRGQLICKETVSVGTLSRALVHPREVFYPAIRHKAASLVVVHNHPSGDPAPSKEDITLTNDLIAAGRIIGIPVNDHIIVGHHAFVSLRQHGVNF